LGANFIGNSIKVASGTGFTVQTAFIMSNPSGSIARLDKSAGTLGSTGGVGKLAGSISLNSSDDAIFELGVAGNDFLVESGSYTIGGTVTIAAAGGSQNPIRIIGYSSGPGVCSSTTTKPILTTTTLITLGANWDMACMTANGSSSSGTVTSGNNSRFYFSKFVNTSTTANAAALTLGTEAWAFGIEAVSYRGRAVSTAANAAQIHGCYLHDSDIGLRIATTTAYATVTDCTIAGNYTAAISVASASTSPILIDHCTLYGAENNLGIGVSIVTGVTDLRITSSIIKGFTTGVSHADAQTVGFDAYNFYHDNTTDATNWHLGPGSVSGTDPAFTAVTQQTGTGATSSTNMLTAASGTPFSSVVDNQDFVTLTSGSGAGFATGKYLITAHTDNTVTVSSNITSSGSGSSIAWEVTLGHNFAIGAALKALGYPGVFPGGLTTGYLDPGAVQRQEGGAGGTRIY
jgi:hypothetical protein